MEIQQQSPHLLSPVDGGAIDILTPTFVWEAAHESHSYRLQVAADDIFQTILFDATVGEAHSLTIYDVLPAQAQVLYWRVGTEATKAWSATEAFTTGKGAGGKPQPAARTARQPDGRAVMQPVADENGTVMAPYLYGSTSQAAVMTALLVMVLTVVVLSVLIALATPGM